MNPLGVIWEFISSELQDTELLLPTVILAAILSGILSRWNHIKKCRLKIGIVAIAFGVVIAEYNFLLKWHNLSLYTLTAFSLIASIICFCILPLWNQYLLYKIKALCKRHSYVEALNCINSIKPEWFTDKQLRDYQKQHFFVLVNLGSIRKAKVYLDGICQTKGTFYHFARHILAYYSGDLKTSFLEIQAAEDSDDLKDNPFLQFQVIMNHGVCYAAEKNYHLADEYYKKAIAFYKAHQLRDEELWGTFYYNFAFNCLRLNPNTAEWESVLDECQAGLNMKKTDAQIRMLNLRLELLCQTEAPRETINKLVQMAFATIMSGKLPLKNQVIFASSVARVAWAAQVNPIPPLKFLTDNLSIIEELPAHQRYQVYNELDILFHDFHGPTNNPFEELKKKVSDYLKTQAESDLRMWQSGLPEEAVYERCDCLKKIAILHRNCLPYKRDIVISFQQNSIRFYHDNELYLDELRTRQDVIDELLDPRNRDKDHRAICVEEIREQLSSIEELLPQLTNHPALVESYIRLGCYYLDLDEYEQSLRYIQLFRGTDISVQNFAPWLRRYYASLILHTRVLLFDKAIKEAATDNRIRSFSEEIQKWFSSYPKHDGSLDALLLGRFMSIPTGKTKVWIPKGESTPQGHTWLWSPQLNLNIDLTYPQFTDDRFCKTIFFFNGRHPFESGSSLTLKLSQQEAPLIFDGILCHPLNHGLNQNANEMADTIFQFISNHIHQDCPTMEEFNHLIQEFIAPVPIK